MTKASGRKRITVGVTLPVKVCLTVEADESDRGYAIVGRCDLAHGQSEITERTLSEHCDEETWEQIDEIARAALEISS